MSESSFGEFFKQAFADKPSLNLLRMALAILFILLAVSVSIHFYKAYKGQHSRMFWGIVEVNADSIIVTKIETVTKIVYVDKPVYIQSPQREPTKKTSKPSISQKIDSGSSGLQNNAPNNGYQAGRDINISNERKFSEQELNQTFREVNEFIKSNNLPPTCIELALPQGSNAAKVYSQLQVFFRDKGYTVNITGLASVQVYNGISYDKPTIPIGSCIMVIVGSF